MKEKSIVTLIFLFISLTIFASCDMPQKETENFTGDCEVSQNSHESVKNETEEVAFSCYLDSDFLTTTIDNLEIQFSRYYEYESLNVNLSFEYFVINNQNEEIQIQFDDIRVVRELSGISYEHKIPVGAEIEAGLKERINLNFEIPTSIHEDNYYLEFSLNGKILRYYLYYTPDELLEIHTVSFVIDGTIVHEEQVLHGKSIPHYEWYSKDHQYYCVSWSTPHVDEDKDYTYPISQVKADLTLEGKKNHMLQFMSLSSDKYAFAQDLNDDSFIPSDKTIVIPDEYNGKPIRISNFFFDSDLKDVEIVYIPNTDKIYLQYFSKTKIHTIHFAGSEDEWLALGVDLPSTITVHYNSTFVES